MRHAVSWHFILPRDVGGGLDLLLLIESRGGLKLLRSLCASPILFEARSLHGNLG